MHRYILSILIVMFLTELIDSILVYNNLPIRVPFYISIFFHDSLWLMAFWENVRHNKMVKVMLYFFWVFSIVNFCIIEIVDAYNYYTFIVGALFYVIAFIYESYQQLRKENLMYFVSNNYILLSAPVFFFFGMGILMGFKSAEVTRIVLFNNVTLYVFIINIVCVAYYSLINIYIYREKSILK